MPEIVVVQSIKSVWTKNSRGGRLASLRAAVPEALTIPTEENFPRDGFVLHEVVYRESNEFGVPLADTLKAVRGDSLEVGCVTVERAEEAVAVRYQHRPECGAPARFGWGGRETVKSFVLGPGETGRVAYNGRFRRDGWWYEKVVVNVGRCAELSPEVLTRSKPAHEIKGLAILW